MGRKICNSNSFATNTLKLKKNKIILTGASGFIGGYVLENLSKNSSYEIHCITNQKQISNTYKNVIQHHFDLLNFTKESDQQLIEWAVACEVPLHILLTKCDKLKRAEARQVLKEVEAALECFHGHTLSIQLFSSLDSTGLQEAHERLDRWFIDLEGSHE